MNMDEIKDNFLAMIAQLEGDEMLSFETFVGVAIEERLQMIHAAQENEGEDRHVHDGSCNHDHSSGGGSITRSSGAKIFKLNKIISDLRERLPINAESPNEDITIPNSEEFEGYTKDNVVHVDGFLYTEDDVDEMCDEGKLSRNYCLKCGSKDTKPLNFISHSASVPQLQYLFQVLLKDKIKNKTVLDVGSRLGAMLYAGYLFTDARKLIGVEMNEYFCKLQTEIVRKHRMTDRIEIVKDNLLNQGKLLQTADIVIMNNVFQFFCPKDIQRRLWDFLYEQLKGRKGTILVTIPSLQEQLKDAGYVIPEKKKSANKKKKVAHKPPQVLQAEKAAAAAVGGDSIDGSETQQSVGDWSSWLREIETRVTGHEFVEEMSEDDLEDLKLVHVYEVL